MQLANRMYNAANEVEINTDIARVTFLPVLGHHHLRSLIYTQDMSDEEVIWQSDHVVPLECRTVVSSLDMMCSCVHFLHATERSAC
jgi:hypothetical protein